MEWLNLLLKAAGMFFLNPLFYLGIFYAVYLGYIRVKRERKDFTVRVQDGWLETRIYLKSGFIYGLLLSAVLFIPGVTVPLPFLLMLSVVTLLAGVLFKPGLLSPAYTAGISLFLCLALLYFSPGFLVIDRLLSGIEPGWFSGIAFLSGILLMAEGLLIQRNASRKTSPKLIRSRRGLNVGIHESKRLWMVPLLLLVPADVLPVPFDFWPFVPFAGGKLTMLVFPYWIGFSGQVRSVHPEAGFQAVGKKVFYLGAGVTALGIAGFWLPVFTAAGAGLAVIGRLTISVIHYYRDRGQVYYFSKNEPGIVILDIIPGTPADKMNLKIGEVIRTVNGVKIHNEREFYEALQRNRAYCKLEVIDDNGENRFVNRALYEGEHHELGIITFQPEYVQEQGAS